MKRDWDCVRAILLELEKLGDSGSRLTSDEVPNFDSEKASYHMQLMGEAGLIETRSMRESSVALRMTWAGHELLDKIRSGAVWNTVKHKAMEQGVSLSLDLIKALATKIIENLF